MSVCVESRQRVVADPCFRPLLLKVWSRTGPISISRELVRMQTLRPANCGSAFWQDPQGIPVTLF